MEEKICKKCSNSKSLDQFCNRKGEKDGKHRYCKLCMKENNDKYYYDNHEERRKYLNETRKKNPDYFRKKSKEHYDTKKEKYREWNRNKYKTDLEYKLRHILAARLSVSLRKFHKTKTDSTIDYLGCTLEFYITYLESLFTPEMSWDNYGIYWQIDHIIPVDSFDLSNEEQVKICFHYTNTQPLQWLENRLKSNLVDQY